MKPSDIAEQAARMREEIRKELQADIAAATKKVEAPRAGPDAAQADSRPRTQTCPGCRGSGDSPFGGVCGACGGSGVIGSG